MIVYADSSILARAYLVDEAGHTQAVALLKDPERPVITGSWSRIEVSGALVRAARTASRPRAVDEAGLLTAFDSDTGPNGAITVLAVPQQAVERRAMELVREHGLRAMDAWHLAAALIVAPELSDPDEPVGFASRDEQQRSIAKLLGLTAL